VSLGLLDLALELAAQSDSESKWRQLGELALSSGQLDVARRCFVRAKDLGGLLLLHSSHADAAGLGELAAMAGERTIGQEGCLCLCLWAARLFWAARFSSA
jgi:coatomer subunit beta'